MACVFFGHTIFEHTGKKLRTPVEDLWDLLRYVNMSHRGTNYHEILHKLILMGIYNVFLALKS